MKSADIFRHFQQGKFCLRVISSAAKMATGMNGYTNSLDLEEKVQQVRTFAFFDIETTGLKEPKKITEISIVAVHRDIVLDRISKLENAFNHKKDSADLLNIARPRVAGKFSICINPEKPIEREAEKITGLSNIELQDQGAFDHNKFYALNQFLGQFEAPVCLIAHNGNRFDFPILKTHVDSIRKTLMPGLLCADSMVGLRKTVPKPRVEVVAAEVVTRSRTIASPAFALREEQVKLSVVTGQQKDVQPPKSRPADVRGTHNSAHMPLKQCAVRLRRDQKEGSPSTQLASQLSEELTIETRPAKFVSKWSMNEDEVKQFGLQNGPDSLDMLIAEIGDGVSDDDQIEEPAKIDYSTTSKPSTSGLEFHSPEKKDGKVSPPRTPTSESKLVFPSSTVTRYYKFPRTTPRLVRSQSLEERSGPPEAKEVAPEMDSVTSDVTPLKSVVRSFKFSTPTSVRARMSNNNVTITPKRLFVPKAVASSTVSEARIKPVDCEYTTPTKSIAIQTDIDSMRGSYKSDPAQPIPGVDQGNHRKRLFEGDGGLSPSKRERKLAGQKLKDYYTYFFGCDIVSAHEAEADVWAMIAVCLAAGKGFTDWVDRNATDFNRPLNGKKC